METIEHKLLLCPYVDKIWKEILKLTSLLVQELGREEDQMKKIFAAIKTVNPIAMSIHAETLITILRLKDDQNYLLRPQKVAELVIKRLIKMERRQEVKETLQSLLL